MPREVKDLQLAGPEQCPGKRGTRKMLKEYSVIWRGRAGQLCLSLFIKGKKTLNNKTPLKLKK